MIPKIIHYCWFGKQSKSPLAKKCVASWSILREKGYQMIKWNEDNFDVMQNEAVYKAYQDKRYAFVSDYARLKALYEHGGIYLDTDVEIFRDLTPLMDCDLLLGRIYDASIGTAVIGSVPKNDIIGRLVGFYDRASYPTPASELGYFVFEEFTHLAPKMINNNDLFTAYFIKYVPGYQSCARPQKIGGVHIYPKNYFEGESFSPRCNYARHYGEGSWLDRPLVGSSLPEKVKQLLKKDFVLTRKLWDRFYRIRHNRRVPFYRFSDQTQGHDSEQ